MTELPPPLVAAIERYNEALVARIRAEVAAQVEAHVAEILNAVSARERYNA